MPENPVIGKGHFESIRRLAMACDRSHTAVQGWVKHRDWPFSRKPPWKRKQLPDILRWAAEMLAPRTDTVEGENPDDLTALRKEKLRKEIRKLHANADQAETALAKERGGLIDAEQVERDWASIAVVIRNGFTNLASQIVPLALSHGMPGEAAAEFNRQVEESVAGILRHLSHDGRDDGEAAEAA